MHQIKSIFSLPQEFRWLWSWEEMLIAIGTSCAVSERIGRRNMGGVVDDDANINVFCPINKAGHALN